MIIKMRNILLPIGSRVEPQLNRIKWGQCISIHGQIEWEIKESGVAGLAAGLKLYLISC